MSNVSSKLIEKFKNEEFYQIIYWYQKECNKEFLEQKKDNEIRIFLWIQMILIN